MKDRKVRGLEGWKVKRFKDWKDRGLKDWRVFMYLELDQTEAYQTSRELGKVIWDEVITWKFLPQKTIGLQITRSADSVSANIAEAFGRYGKKDKIRFCYFARGSVTETSDWLEKSFERNLITKEKFENLKKLCETLPFQINKLIKYWRVKLRE